METVACTSSASAQISSISDSDVPQTSAQVPYLGTGVSSANEAYCYGDPAGTLFAPHSPQLFADPSLGVFTPGPQFPSLGATPWDFPPRRPGALLPWWQSSNVSHGNQNVQQFVNSPVPVPPHRPVSHTFWVRFIEGNVSVGYGCRNKYPKKAEPPDNICLQIEEWREFTPPGALAPQTCWSNTYLRVRCVQLNGLTLTLTLRWSLMMTSEPLNFSLTRTQSTVNLVYTPEHCVVSC